MFEKYTEKARRSSFFARYEVGRFSSRAIDTEHLLLGLLREKDSLAEKVLCGSGMNLSMVRQRIESNTTDE